MMKMGNSYEESRLLIKVRKGDEFAFRLLFDAYHKNVYFLGKKFLKSDSAGEDLVQEVFIAIWTNRQKLADIKDFRKYLNTIAINHIYNLLKRKAYADEFIKHVQLIRPQNENSGVDLVDNSELQRLLRQATQQLPPQQKKAFELSRYHGLKHDQIAEHMDISRETVKKHCMEATRNIKTWLKNNGIDASYLLLFFW